MYISLYLNTLQQKGYLAYEYNPFHNYLTNVDLYLVNNKFLVPKGCAVNVTNGEILKSVKIDDDKTVWVDKYGNVVENAVAAGTGNPDITAGSLIDLDTELLNFDLEHPVDITVQPSYDGSVNLIINDGKNIPRLINSRFSLREKNTYEIVDRIGENDTNIYNSETFDKDTALYFLYELNPKIHFTSFIKGELQVGLYILYLSYCDSDDNESDIIVESGLIPVFIGSSGNPYSMDGGIKNQLSNKGISVVIENIDKSYNYFKVYYLRYFADYQLNRVYELKKILLKYPINYNTISFQLYGNEAAEPIDPNILNISRFNPKSVLTLTQCKNMLFFGNIVKNTDNYVELSDCALRIIPRLLTESINLVPLNYNGSNNGYYNISNVYNKVGYWNLEYYRFGVVFIYQNGMLSNVYNTVGYTLEEKNDTSFKCTNNTLYSELLNGSFLKRKYVKTDDFGWIDASETSDIYDGVGNKKLNARGVCRIYTSSLNLSEVIGIKFDVPLEVCDYLKDLGIRGMFFVRLKCVPNILAQCYLLPMDEVMEGPIIKCTDGNFTECFVQLLKIKTTKKIFHIFRREFVKYYKTVENPGLLLTQNYGNRLYKYEGTGGSFNAYAGICPDFLLDLPYFNQIFNGSDFKLQKVSNSDLTLILEGRFYRMPDNINYNIQEKYENVIINTVTDNVPSIAIKDETYKLEMGKTEEAFRFKFAGVDTATESGELDREGKNVGMWADNIVRGKFSPYLAIYSTRQLDTGMLYNIYRDTLGISEKQEFQTRMDSYDSFYAISDRYNFEQFNSVGKTRYITCWRGDCYINNFTYRLNRNFNDPSLPNNDEILVSETWKKNYPNNAWKNILKSDVNAVQLGSWITLRVKSAINYALRSEDHSFTSEEALMGLPRSFYPRNLKLYLGSNKMPDSYLYNDAYRATLGYKAYYNIRDINYIKNTFSNRIQYSAIAIQDSFKNNYRESLSTYFRDYSIEYGGITKLVEFQGNLLVILEHGIGLAVVNERVVAGNGDGDPVFINTNNVLPQELSIISDTYGSQWGESIVKSEAGYVYGVDTIAKKIWRYGESLEILSDFRVNKFLIDNITLGERENTPYIGIRNVKTHYNNNKKDIMFTFYDNTYKDEEKVWNLCYNELMNLFITFYSWVPSYSENIDTQFFTFNRETSKELALLRKCNYLVPENKGVLLGNVVLVKLQKAENEPKYPVTYSTDIHYRYSQVISVVEKSDNSTDLTTKTLEPNDNIKFKLEKDHWGYYKWFDSDELEKGVLSITFENEKDLQEFFKIMKDRNQKAILLLITPTKSDELKYTATESTQFTTETVALTFEEIVDNLDISNETLPNLTTDFYLHGQAGIFDITENVYPTHWYGKTHPFEFEFVVNENLALLKVFNNLIIISNKAEPESIHFEIEGDNYEFSADKRTMYFRLEATKELYQNLGSDILFNRKYTDVVADSYTKELYYRAKNNKYEDQYSKIDKVYPVEELGLVLQEKSSIFPLYYSRVDTYNNIYDDYLLMLNSGYDYQNLSGSEISWNRDLNQFNVITHVKHTSIDLFGRLRGNSRYKEGKWNFLIPSIIFNLKNEKWVDAKSAYNSETIESSTIGESGLVPPLVITSIPDDLKNGNITTETLPKSYSTLPNTNIANLIDTNDWTLRKEARIRDKWIKIKVRYSGENLAIIHSIATLYNFSYS